MTTKNLNTLGYDDLAKVVNEAYAEIGDVRATSKKLGLPFSIVFEMTGYKDVYDFELEDG